MFSTYPKHSPTPATGKKINLTLPQLKPAQSVNWNTTQIMFYFVGDSQELLLFSTGEIMSWVKKNKTKQKPKGNINTTVVLRVWLDNGVFHLKGHNLRPQDRNVSWFECWVTNTVAYRYIGLFYNRWYSCTNTLRKFAQKTDFQTKFPSNFQRTLKYSSFWVSEGSVLVAWEGH